MDAYEPTADDLALLEAACVWVGDCKSFNALGPSGYQYGHGETLLREPFEGAMAFALMRKMGYARVAVDEGGANALVISASGTAIYATHPSSPLLALCRAMRDAGLLRTEPTIREVAQRVKVATDAIPHLCEFDKDAALLARHVLATEPER